MSGLAKQQDSVHHSCREPYQVAGNRVLMLTPTRPVLVAHVRIDWWQLPCLGHLHMC
jgi:hypothetical protein